MYDNVLLCPPVIIGRACSSPSITMSRAFRTSPYVYHAVSLCSPCCLIVFNMLFPYVHNVVSLCSPCSPMFTMIFPLCSPCCLPVFTMLHFGHTPHPLHYLTRPGYSSCFVTVPMVGAITVPFSLSGMIVLRGYSSAGRYQTRKVVLYVQCSNS